MTSIPLREYIHDIENLISKGKVAYAEQHCMNILRYFPKQVDTYRLLGKSCLDLEKIDEAANIFQRVLTVFPDDFVSLVGLGIIKEDQEDLDSSIGYMEMASEVEPSNTDIQSEIRRLYFKRDGIAPDRNRTTRGSLVRTYFKAELFNQAILKARSALSEEPQRLDLQLLLARTYYHSGRKMEAAEICIQIVNKLPYCLEANKILFIICSSLNRSAESRIFQQRINELEPYSALISKSYPAPSQVPDEAILLERIDTPLKEWELFIPTGEEPAAELIRILSSPVTSPVLDNSSDVHKVSIPFREDDFLQHFQQHFKSDDQTIADIENSESWFPGLDTSSELKQQERMSRDNFPEQDHPTPIKNNLPDWLQNFSRENEKDQQNLQPAENDGDWIDFFNPVISGLSQDADTQPGEISTSQAVQSDQEQLLDWMSSSYQAEISTKEQETNLSSKNVPVDEPLINGFQNEISNDIKNQITEESDNSFETPGTDKTIDKDASNLQDQLRRILMQDENWDSNSADNS